MKPIIYLGIVYGQDPDQRASQEVRELAVSANENPKLLGVESFVTPGGWHLLFKYLIREHRWVSELELRDMKGLAHGPWEAELGIQFLKTASTLPAVG